MNREVAFFAHQEVDAAVPVLDVHFAEHGAGSVGFHPERDRKRFLAIEHESVAEIGHGFGGAVERVNWPSQRINRFGLRRRKNGFGGGRNRIALP